MALRIKSFTDRNAGGFTLNKVIHIDVDKLCATYLSQYDDNYFWIEMESCTKYLISTDEYSYAAFIAYWKG